MTEIYLHIEMRAWPHLVRAAVELEVVVVEVLDGDLQDRLVLHGLTMQITMHD